MILNSVGIDDIKQFKLNNVLLKDKENWHFALLRGWATFKNVSLMDNKLIIAILIKISTINEGKLDKTRTN